LAPSETLWARGVERPTRRDEPARRLHVAHERRARAACTEHLIWVACVAVAHMHADDKAPGVERRSQARRLQGRFRRTLPDGTQVRSYKELYAYKIKQQDAASKELRDRQKRIKENQGPNAKQVKMFKDLHKLLRCKVDMQQRARAEAVAAANMEQEETNVFTMPDDNGEAMGF